MRNEEKAKKKVRIFYERITDSKALLSIRNGLVSMLPVLLLGSFAVVFRSLPIPAYLKFIYTFQDGMIFKFFSLIYNGTLGILSIYFTITISRSYERLCHAGHSDNNGAMITSLICFVIFSGVLQEDVAVSVLGVSGVFTAILCALVASALYCAIDERMLKSLKLYTDGASHEFHRALFTLIPMVVVVSLFALINRILAACFEVATVQALFSMALRNLFSHLGTNLKSMIVFSALNNLLWFFGIHGGDILAPVTIHVWYPAMEINQQLIASGSPATEIYTQTFYDVFVAMGGSGTTISLLLAIFLFSKRRSNRSLAKFSAIPMLINVNEIMMFGLPIVLNPIMFMPFVLVGVVLVLVSTAAMRLGLVPLAVNTVQWTTPPLLGGYIATGSIAGSLLQLFNIFIGTLIYWPFVRLYDREKGRDVRRRMDQLVSVLKESELKNQSVELMALQSQAGDVARDLAEKIQYRLKHQLPRIFYQPQFDNRNECVGAEALLRWEDSTYGMLYPPLLVKIAAESGLLEQLEEGVFLSVMKDMECLQETLGEGTRVSVNVTGYTIQTAEFEEFLTRLTAQYPEYVKCIYIEITEQTALHFDDVFTARLDRIRNMGFALAIDDFSMGNTSIKYLQTSVFNQVKLDGALSRDILDNPRSREIIASIAALTNTFGISVLAEYVETAQQKDALEEVGCCLYQGYLYSPAIPLEELKKKVQERTQSKEK